MSYIRRHKKIQFVEKDTQNTFVWNKFGEKKMGGNLKIQKDIKTDRLNKVK